MSPRIFALFTLAVLSPGCIPVTEPVGDIDKAVPDKEIVGEWERQDGEGGVWVVDVPDVKGNPKGLMRATYVEKGKKKEDATDENISWFFTATVGKQEYANVLLVQGDKEFGAFAQFRTEGAFADWAKNEKRGYGIAPFKFDGEKLTVWFGDNYGDKPKLDQLMKENKFSRSGGIYQTSKGWIAKQLEKDGLMGVLNELGTFVRVKK